MAKKPLLVIAGEQDQEFYRRLLLPKEAVIVATPSRVREDLKGEGWDLILLDCGNEGGTGLRLLEEIKSGFPGIPVIFVTGASSEETAIAAFRMGARDYFKKPLNALELKNVVDNLLELKRKTQQRRQALYRNVLAESLKKEGVDRRIIPSNLLRSIQYIENHVFAPLGLETLAREAGMSKYHFCRAFKAHVGMSPVKFARYIKIQAAKQMFRKEGLSVSTVALKLGFCDLSSFIKCFKSFEGKTPTDFKASLS